MLQVRFGFHRLRNNRSDQGVPVADSWAHVFRFTVEGACYSATFLLKPTFTHNFGCNINGLVYPGPNAINNISHFSFFLFYFLKYPIKHAVEKKKTQVLEM